MSDVTIELINVDVVFPIHNGASLSFKNKALSSLTKGRIDREHDGILTVKSLSDISLTIKPGERVGLIGSNGAGKTTLLRTLSGIYHPTKGQALIQGQCTSLINISLGIDPEATGRENIVLRATMMGMQSKEIQPKIDEIISFTKLGDFIDLPFRTYSTGMQLRLAFAVSTTIDPQILIMDEWLSTGDEGFKEQAEKRLNNIISTAEILVIASHSRELLLNNCNRVIWLENGMVKMDGSPHEVTQEYFNQS